MPIHLPAAIVADAAILAVIHTPVPVVYGAGEAAVRHPPEAWELWTHEDWMLMCPEWTILPLVDAPPAEAGKKAVRRPQSEWAIGTNAVAVTYELVALTPEEIVAQRPPVPAVVTNFQARAALLAAGLFDQVDAAIKAQPVTSAAYQAWEYANELTRAGVLVNTMAAELGLSAGQLDELFRAAAEIEA